MKAHELLSTPDKWCQKHFAETSGGWISSPNHPAATKFCILGAVQRCYPDPKTRMEKEKQIRDKLERVSISTWNDYECRTHEEVYSLLKELDI